MGHSQISRFLEQVLSQGQYQLVDGKQGGSLPAPDQVTKLDQLLSQIGNTVFCIRVDCDQVQSFQPVSFGTGPQEILNRVAFPKGFGHVVHAGLGFNILAILPAPNTIHGRQLGSRVGSAR